MLIDNDIKEYYESQIRRGFMPPFEKLKEEKWDEISRSFGFQAWRLARSLRELKKSLIELFSAMIKHHLGRGKSN